MKLLVFVLFSGVFLSSCHKEIISQSDSNCVPVVISQDDFLEIPAGQINITQANISDDCLTMTLGISGCDMNHTIKMISDGGIDESLPSQITFDFEDEEPQLCEAYFIIERQYDLLPIRVLTEEDIIIRFRNSALSVLYNK